MVGLTPKPWGYMEGARLRAEGAGCMEEKAELTPACLSAGRAQRHTVHKKVVNM